MRNPSSPAAIECANRNHPTAEEAATGDTCVCGHTVMVDGITRSVAVAWTERADAAWTARNPRRSATAAEIAAEPF